MPLNLQCRKDFFLLELARNASEKSWWSIMIIKPRPQV